MTYLILGEPEDDSVIDLAAALASRECSVAVVMSSDLIGGSSLSYVIDDEQASFWLELDDGTVLSDSNVELVINRLVLDRAPAGSGAHERYVGEEWHAALGGWMRTMTCPVLNPPRGTSITGLRMSEAEWRAAAARVGLPTADWPGPTRADTTMLAISGDVIAGSGPVAELGETAAWWADGLLELADAVGLPLLEGCFDLGEGEGFVTANPMPDIGSYGEAAISAIERAAQAP